MKLNEDKCHLMLFGDKSNDVSLNIGRITIKESTEEKLLGIILDKRLCFKQQIKSICKRVVKSYMPSQEFRTFLILIN